MPANYMTRKSYERLSAEARRLKEVEITRVSREKMEAAQQGDLRENAGYEAARDRLNLINARLNQIAEQLSDAQFHSRYITREVCDLSVWTKLQKDNYPGRTHDIVALLAVCLRNLRAKLTAMEANRIATETEEFVMLPPFEAVFHAIRASQQDHTNDPKRTIMFLAPQGFGKSALGRAIRRDGKFRGLDTVAGFQFVVGTIQR